MPLSSTVAKRGFFMRTYLLAAVVALASCNQAASDGDAAAPANTFDQQLRSLDVPARNFSLRKAILDTGARCGRVDGSAFQQQYKHTAMWVVHCTETGDFAVFVSPTGYAQVVKCESIAEAGPQCRLPVAAG